MNSNNYLPQSERNQAKAAAQSVLFLMAVFATILGFLYLIGLAGKIVVDGSVHSVSSPGIQTISAIIAILLDLSLLILFIALRWQISGKNLVFADLAAVFMLLVCATSTINWFVQLTLVPRIAQAGNAAWLALLDVHEDLSIMYAIEHLGWGLFYGLATIFMAVALGGSKLENWVRGLLIVGGTLSILHLIGIIIASPFLADLGYLAWGVFLPVTTLLLAVQYKSIGLKNID
jgi:hypothetical protein